MGRIKCARGESKRKCIASQSLLGYLCRILIDGFKAEALDAGNGFQHRGDSALNEWNAIISAAWVVGFCLWWWARVGFVPWLRSMGGNQEGGLWVRKLVPARHVLDGTAWQVTTRTALLYHALTPIPHAANTGTSPLPFPPHTCHLPHPRPNLATPPLTPSHPAPHVARAHPPPPSYPKKRIPFPSSLHPRRTRSPLLPGTQTARPAPPPSS